MLELTYFIAFVVAFVACIRILHMNSRAELPELFANGVSVKHWIRDVDQLLNSANDEGFLKQILKHAPIFSKPYIPPLLWGRSGHLQTIIHSTFGRHRVPREKGDSRHELQLPDGSTLTFDLFQPLRFESISQDVTLCVCPGVGTSSETISLRAFSHHANECGFRVAVLNHLGVIPNIPLTAPRIFHYGGTEEYDAMVKEVISMYPDSKLVAVGFSMGGNIVCKYLGEKPCNRAKFIGAVSCCQGYDINRVLQLLKQWRHLGHGYLRALHITVKKVVMNFQDVLLDDNIVDKFSVNKKEVLGSNSLPHLDEIFLSKLAGYENMEEYYTKSSSAFYIPQIDIPILFINALDDPLTPPQLFDVPVQHTAVNGKALFVRTKHGGHLGYFERQMDMFARGTYTWLDKAIVEYIQALLKVVATCGITAGHALSVMPGDSPEPSDKQDEEQRSLLN